MSCTPYEEVWGQNNLNGLYDESDMAYDDSVRTFDGVLFTVYSGISDISTSYTKDSDQSTTYTEEWVLTTAGAYDDSAEAYDASDATYDGIFFTVYDKDANQSTNYRQIGLCLELLDTGGELLLDTGGDNLTWTSL